MTAGDLVELANLIAAAPVVATPVEPMPAVRLPDLCESAFICLSCWHQIDVREVWQEPPPEGRREPVYTHLTRDGHPVARIDRWHRATPPVAPPDAEMVTDEDVNAAIDALAEKAKRGVYGISGHAWGARATVDQQASLLKRALAASPGETGGQ